MTRGLEKPGPAACVGHEVAVASLCSVIPAVAVLILHPKHVVCRMSAESDLEAKIRHHVGVIAFTGLSSAN